MSNPSQHALQLTDLLLVLQDTFLQGLVHFGLFSIHEGPPFPKLTPGVASQHAVLQVAFLLHAALPGLARDGVAVLTSAAFTTGAIGEPGLPQLPKRGRVMCGLAFGRPDSGTVEAECGSHRPSLHIWDSPWGASCL